MMRDHLNKSLTKPNFNSRTVDSLSLKIQLFLSSHIVHIKQRGAAFHAKELLCLLNPLHQPNKTSITPIGITDCILNIAKVKDLSSVATMQRSNKRYTISVAGPLRLSSKLPLI